MPYDLSNLQWDCDCVDQKARMASIMQTVQGYFDYLETLNRPFAVYFKETEPNAGEWATVWFQLYGTLTIPLWANLLWMTSSGFGGYYINTPNGAALIDSPYAAERVEIKKFATGNNVFINSGAGMGNTQARLTQFAFNLPRPAYVILHLLMADNNPGVTNITRTVQVRPRLVNAAATPFEFVAVGVDRMDIDASLVQKTNRPHFVHMGGQWIVPAGAWTFEQYIINNDPSNILRWGSAFLANAMYTTSNLTPSALEIIYA